MREGEKDRGLDTRPGTGQMGQTGMGQIQSRDGRAGTGTGRPIPDLTGDGDILR